jgi:hypothetical protein
MWSISSLSLQLGSRGKQSNEKLAGERAAGNSGERESGGQQPRRGGKESRYL